MLLTVCLPTFRTSRSFWKFPTVSPTSVWQFIGSGEHCFWMSWISKSFLWALHRWSIYYSRSSFDLFCHFHGFIFIWLRWLCSKLLVYVITFPLLCVFQTGDWTWLKEFYQRLIDQKWQRKKKSKERWYQKAILSKFLYYRWVEFAFLKWCKKIILTVTLKLYSLLSCIYIVLKQFPCIFQYKWWWGSRACIRHIQWRRQKLGWGFQLFLAHHLNQHSDWCWTVWWP